jgi:tetratricopeptide (TPR) repeat protein
MSPYLVRLDNEFRLAQNENARAEVEAKRAAYLSRTGDFSGAREIVRKLRVDYRDGHAVRVTILIMIAEALTHHFESLSRVGLDRIVRAEFLSRMIKDRQLEAITSAWRAHIEFENSMFIEMFTSLESAHEQATICDCNEALARVANIACKVALLCGESALAKKQFLIGRERALAVGDQASIEALQHNKAAFRLSRLRSNMCFGVVHAAEIKETKVEIASARSLQQLTRITALSVYIDLCESHLLMVEGRWSDAMNALTLIRGAGPFPAGTFSVGLVDLEISFCLASMGRYDEALRLYGEIEGVELNALDADERLFVSWLQLRLAEQDERFGTLSAAKSKFQDSASEYHSMIEVLKNGLNRAFCSEDNY